MILVGHATLGDTQKVKARDVLAEPDGCDNDYRKSGGGQNDFSYGVHACSLSS